MGRINVLSFAVANLIAAGEVVDRPASAVKELLENAIDAGATRVTVEIQQGGVTFLRVSDNGCGIDVDDLPVAVRRHATSKIKTAEDLEGIETLGFRGEALAAIASVSDMRIISKTADAEVGAMLEVKAGNIISLTERACATGTTIIVENLFANVPARRKFLKRDVTEASAVTAWVEKIALSEPSIAIRMIVDGNVKFETEGNGDLKSAIYSIFGRDFATRLIEVCSEIDGVEVKGYIGRSDNFKSNRNFQNFFINRRYIRSKTASAALEQAYSSYIPTEKFPCCVLNVRINPKAVDVNVHPAKLEVKFSNEKPVFDAIYYTVRSALEQDQTRPAMEFIKPKSSLQAKIMNAFVPVEDRKKTYKNVQLTFAAPAVEKPTQEPIAPVQAPPPPVERAPIPKEILVPEVHKAEEKAAEIDLYAQMDRLSKELIESNLKKREAEQPVQEAVPVKEEVPAAPMPEPTIEAPEYRIIGEAFHSYVFVQTGERILIIDKHAAHERVLFEELREKMKKTEASSQMLMFPLEVMLTSDEIQTLENYRTEIEKVGFQFTLKKHAAEIQAIPTGISTDAVCDMFIVIADRILNETGNAEVSRELIFEGALYQASCKAAIKAGREYPEDHVKWLVDTLMRLPDITFCPHGRPIAIEMTKSALNHQFERE